MTPGKPARSRYRQRALRAQVLGLVAVVGGPARLVYGIEENLGLTVTLS